MIYIYIYTNVCILSIKHALHWVEIVPEIMQLIRIEAMLIVDYIKGIRRLLPTCVINDTLLVSLLSVHYLSSTKNN